MASDGGFHVVVLDFGVKQGIIDCLNRLQVNVTLMPGETSLEEIWAQKPHGLFLSNGPGDPKTEKFAHCDRAGHVGEDPHFFVSVLDTKFWRRQWAMKLIS